MNTSSPVKTASFEEVEEVVESIRMALKRPSPPYHYFPLEALRETEWPCRKPSSERVSEIASDLDSGHDLGALLIRGNGRIVDGHARLRAARRLGHKTIACQFLNDLDEGQCFAALLEPVGKEFYKWKSVLEPSEFEDHLEAKLCHQPGEEYLFDAQKLIRAMTVLES